MGGKPDEDVLDAVQALMFQFKGHMRRALQGLEEGVGPMEARALGFFARHPGACASELVAHSGRDKAQITRLVQQLLDRGLLAREPDPADGRRHRLAPTERGRTVHRLMRKHRQRFAAALTAGLDAQEHQQLLALLQRMAAQVTPAGPA